MSLYYPLRLQHINIDKPVYRILQVVYVTICGSEMTAYLSESINDRKVKFWHNLDSSHKFVLFKFKIDIFDNVEIVYFLVR